MVIPMVMVYVTMKKYLVVWMLLRVTMIQFILMMLIIAIIQLITDGVIAMQTSSTSVVHVADQVSQRETVTATATY